MNCKYKLILLGGNVSDDNNEIYEQFIQMSTPKGQEAYIGILPGGSQTPKKQAESYIQMFKQYYNIQIHQIHIDIHQQQNSYNNEILNELEKYTGIYFPGGDQIRYINILYTQNQQETPALNIIKRRFYNNELAIMGSSAGTQCMSIAPVITGGESYQSIKYGPYTKRSSKYPDDLSYIEQGGLGLFDLGYLDTHFSQRGRFGRICVMGAWLQKSGFQWGFGIDENTGLIYDSTELTIIGQGGVYIYDFSRVQLDKHNIYNVSVNKLTNYDKILVKDNNKLEFVIAQSKQLVIPIITMQSESGFSLVSNDIFSSPDNINSESIRKNPNEFTKLIEQLIKSSFESATGYSYSNNPGLKVIIHKKQDTLGYCAINNGIQCFSYVNVEFDIVEDVS